MEYVCVRCGSKFGDIESFVKHISEDCKLSLTVKCPLCNEEVDIGKYITHLRTHIKFTGTKYICPLCNKSFVKEGDVLRHIREHHVVQHAGKFYCTVCGRDFLSRRSVLVHILKAHGKE